MQLIKLGVVVLTALGASHALAEQASDTSVRSGSLMEEIVVTAQKREESIQDVPIAVTAISGERMEKMHATTLEDLQGSIPNVQVQSFANVPHGAVFNIRGMGVIEPDPYGGTTVVVVEDGVPQFFNMTALLDTFDIERLEALRGPQGTLFGANSTGGVIQAINRAPTGELGAKVEASIGNYDLLEMRGALDFPIFEDQLAGRISVSHQGRDGFVTNIVDNSDMGSRDRTALRAQLLFTPNDTFEARLIGSYSRHRDGGQDSAIGNIPGEALYVPGGSTFPSATYPDAIARQPMYESPCAPGQRCKAPSKYLSANSSVPDLSDMDTYAGTLNMTWSTEIGEFTSITGYKDFELHDFHDQDWTPVFLDDTERLTTGSQFSQELRGVFQLSDNFELLIGGFYATYEWKHFQDFRIQFAAPGLRQLTQNDSDTDTISAFAQAYLDITDRFRIQAGLRYTHEKTKFDSVISTFIDTRGAADLRGKGLNDQAGAFEILLGVLDPSQTDVCDFKRCSESWSNVGGKFGMELDFSDDAMVYAYYARGFKSGGFVGRIGVAQDIGPYNEEYVDTVEVGIKSDWLDNRLRINAAAFHNWYDDIQLASIYFTQDAFGNTINGNSILNAAKATTKGIELDLVAAPTANLAFNVSVGLLDATYDDFPFVDPADTTGNTIIDLSGERLQNTPKVTGNAGVEFVFQAGLFEVTTNAQYRYVAKKFNTNLQNTPRSEIQPTHFVDLNIDLVPQEGSWSIGLFARNLFDERYISSVFDAPGTIGLLDYQDPRTYGVSVRVEM